MAEDKRLARIEILIHQEKYSEAEKVVKDLLSEDANNIYFLSLLAEINLQQDKLDIASTVIDQAIGLSPDFAHLFFIKSRILLQQSNMDEAEAAIHQSIALDPYHAHYCALLAHMRLLRKKYTEALEIADRALEIDAENLLALNTRSAALIKLDRKEESFATIEGALREDPNNAYTHANYGWGLLEKGDHKKALEHFKEALKSNPNLGSAQAGLLQALKASNPVYNLFLKYSFWMGNLTAKYQWGVIIGFYLAVRGLKAVAEANPSLQPYLTPIIVLLTLIAFSTWIINPVSNLFLRFNPYGKLLLKKKEKMSSNFVAVSLGICLAGIAAYFFTKNELFLGIAVFGFTMMLPLGVMFSPSRYKYSLLIYTIVMAVVGTGAILLSFSSGELFNGLTLLYVIGFVAFQWIANFLLIKEDNV